ncbi:uncharacterized protein FIBRA_00808 [Fibroporia radiculosa]|uniref:SAM-dependent MTase RsmB/NOP-type domain-containing protein n=1 Tax=Fibroporia radiculosa TaxID=599839 RepID=J4G0M1_9APHY|nr:uncharacterized protein FIBRA_00808 [Fibroporia radiculosa]CCL98803.1 predicted protein [Fibroporia radiculosa]
MNFYFEAAKVLDKLDAKKGSIKSVIAAVNEKDRKRTAALVIETLKYKQVLVDVIDATKLLKEERKITSKNLALLLVHDLLLTNGIQAGDGPVKQAVFRHKTRLNSELQRIKIKRGAKSNGELAQGEDSRAALIPRYVRVNTAYCTTNEAIEDFISRGFELSAPFASKQGFAKDEHIPDLLAFNPRVSFETDPLYTSGKIILQDKASCFPAYILSPPSTDESVVIDATAAPGNKTSHLCALMKNRGRLFAFERDRKRFSTLKMMLGKAQCQNVEPVNADFLTISPQDKTYAAVTHIGSGIVNRLDYLLDTENENDGEQERLNKLAAFQLSMIKHAMKFPSVEKIVYSTCSVHAIENEQVVRQALTSDEAISGSLVLASSHDVLPQWKRRGLPEEMATPADAASLVRCSPDEDATNGFFVALFVKKKPPDPMTAEEKAEPSAKAAHKRKKATQNEAVEGTTGRRKKRKRSANPD